MTQLGTSARPASLVIAKGERPTIKLIRTPSIDDDDIDSLNKIDQRNQINMNNINSSGNTIPSPRDDDDDDESVPLVQTNCRDANPNGKT